jgi:hypothetical protein
MHRDPFGVAQRASVVKKRTVELGIYLLDDFGMRVPRFYFTS